MGDFIVSIDMDKILVCENNELSCIERIILFIDAFSWYVNTVW